MSQEEGQTPLRKSGGDDDDDDSSSSLRNPPQSSPSTVAPVDVSSQDSKLPASKKSQGGLSTATATGLVPDEDWKAQLRSELMNLPAPVRRPPAPPFASAVARSSTDGMEDDRPGRAMSATVVSPDSRRGRPSKNGGNTNTRVDGQVGAHAVAAPAPRRNRLPPGNTNTTTPATVEQLEAYVVGGQEAPQDRSVTNLQLAVPHKPPWWKSEVFLVSMGALLLATIAIAVIVPLVLQMGHTNTNTGNNNNNLSEQETTNDQVELDVIDFTTLIPSLPNSTILAFSDKNSVQFQAMDFVIRDPEWESMEDWRKQQRFAMACIAFSFDAIQFPLRWYFLDTMSLKSHECDWELQYQLCPRNDGVIRQLGDSFVEAVRLQPGYFPPELALLSNLEVLEFSKKNFKLSLESMFPEQVVLRLPLLTQFVFQDSSKLMGVIPSTIGLFPKLTRLDLTGNQLTSTIPTELGLLSNLNSLALSNNNLSGQVPDVLGDLSSLRTFQLQGNPEINFFPLPAPFCADDYLWETLSTGWCEGKEQCCSGP